MTPGRSLWLGGCNSRPGTAMNALALSRVARSAVADPAPARARTLTLVGPEQELPWSWREPRRVAARVLSLLAPVRPAEVVTLLVLTANVMLLLGSYYLLKTAREPLILSGGAAIKTYASAAQAILLIPVAQLFGYLSRKLPRLHLMAAVTGFFVMNLLVFFALARAGVPIGVPFYIWVGVFNITVIAQFWTFVTDIYTMEQGRRLLAVVGIGAALGGLFGARAARGLFALAGVGGLLLTAALVLVVAFGLTALADRRARLSRGEKQTLPLPDGQSGLGMVLQDRYLQLIAALVLVLNLVNSTGEYIMDRALISAAQAQTLMPAGQFIAGYKADFFSWVSGMGLVLQLVVVSRVMKHLGVGAALYVLPLVALGSYGTLAMVPTLSMMFFAKVAENGLDYSLQSTLRQALYLPTSRDAKYRAKPILDTFVVRGGDVVASVLVWAGQRLAFATSTFALVNAGITVLWLVIAWQLAARHKRLAPTPALAVV
jgi:ATP:ADP antiporter, AAA family